MGIAYNSSIVTSGLVLALDAANTKNYNLTAVEVLVVAGGGGGGARHAGGGGAGGLIYNSNFAVTPGSALTVTVGDGGIGGTETFGWGVSPVSTNGSNSVFGSLTAIGGGAGGYAFAGNSGGSGGGGGDGSGGTLLGGSGTSGQGNTGGNSGSGSYEGGGGGGGAGGIGGNGSNRGGDGGTGLGFNISGTFTYYGGGGGGAAGYNKSSLGGAGGLGGGGRGDNSGSVGAICQNGTSNTGGGGGAHSTNYPTAGSGKAGNGGSGIVIVRYQGPQKAIGGTITSNNGYTIHTFTTVGSTTFTPLVATNNSAILGLSDFSGNNNFGTAVNGPTYSSANGGSLSFDGVDDYVTTGFTRGTLGNYLTLIAWYKYTGTAERTYSAIIGGKEAATEFFIGKNIGNTDIGVQDGNYYSNFVTGSNAFDGNWHQIVYSYDNGTGKIYLDGTLKNTNSFTKCNDAEEIIIGGETESSGFYFNGNISQVSFYNRVLTAAEIQQNFNALKGRFKPEYETLTYTASGNLTVTGNGTNTVNIFKTSGGNAWDNQAYSLVPFTAPCTIEFNKQAVSGDNGVSYAMIGWNADPTTDASYSSIDYASYPYRTDVYSVYHNGSQVHFSGSWSTANKFYIVYGTDGVMRHYNGSTLLYSVNYGTGNTVYVDSSFYSPNATFGGFSNIKVIRSAWNGTDYV